jgi:hypothetical protein
MLSCDTCAGFRVGGRRSARCTIPCQAFTLKLPREIDDRTAHSLNCKAKSFQSQFSWDFEKKCWSRRPL